MNLGKKTCRIVKRKHLIGGAQPERKRTQTPGEGDLLFNLLDEWFLSGRLPRFPGSKSYPCPLPFTDLGSVMVMLVIIAVSHESSGRSQTPATTNGLQHLNSLRRAVQFRDRFGPFSLKRCERGWRHEFTATRDRPKNFLGRYASKESSTSASFSRHLGIRDANRWCRDC